MTADGRVELERRIGERIERLKAAALRDLPDADPEQVVVLQNLMGQGLGLADAGLQNDPAMQDTMMRHLMGMVLDMERQAVAASPPRRAPTLTFLIRADHFLAAREIAQSDDVVDIEQRRRGASLALHDAEMIEMGRVRTVTQLRYLEEAFFTSWDEAPLSETGRFWDAVARQGLPFTRRDRLAEIMDRGRITNRGHYEYAKDEIVAAVQTGRLTEAQAMKLGAMIEGYENR